MQTAPVVEIIRTASDSLNSWGDYAVLAKAPSRLSFTMIDMNGEGGRRNGVASVSLSEPSFEARVSAADELRVSSARTDASHLDSIESLLLALREKWDGPGADVVVTRPVPAHSGFGSKTTTLLAVGKAYARLCGVSPSTEELAKVAGRGGTSGASINLIDRGGFVVDGGHHNPPDFAADPHHYLLPSRLSAPGRKPPVLVSLPFPPWPILVIVGAGLGLNGRPEVDWFREKLPIPREEAHKVAHLVLMNMSPAVAEQDYEAFCAALNVLTRETYFKQAQIGSQSEAVQRVLRDALENGIDAIGMSSMGAMCFAFTRTPTEASSWLDAARRAGDVQDFWFTNAQNSPATFDLVPR